MVQKAKPKTTASTSSDKAVVEKKLPSGLAQNTSLADWANEDEDDPYAAEFIRRQEEQKRNARQAKRKKKRKGDDRFVDFDQIYDPAQPTRLDDYRGSEEAAAASNEWKNRLHAHQLKRRRFSSDAMSIDDNEEAQVSRGPRRESSHIRKPCVELTVSKGAFAPPAQYDFAPPSLEQTARTNDERPRNTAENDDYLLPPVADLPDDPTGDDAYLRRMRMSVLEVNAQSPTMPCEPQEALPQPPDVRLDQHEESPPPPPPPDAVQPGPTQAAPQPGIISAAPVRYDVTAKSGLSPSNAEMDVDRPSNLGLGADRTSQAPESEADTADQHERSSRPGQKGAAMRMMQKMGWVEGKGLGKDNTGITTILQHKAEKRKKKSDAEGGGWAAPAAMGRIVGGKRAKTGGAAADESQEADQSFTIVALLEGMLKDVDVDKELVEGNLMQDIGDRVGNFGQVERLFVARDSADTDQDGPKVFVKFTSPLSAYRAIQAAQGQDFLGNGRMVRARFWDADKFEQGVYS